MDYEEKMADIYGIILFNGSFEIYCFAWLNVLVFQVLKI